MKIEKIEGMICAPFTPFHEDGNVNFAMIGQYAANLRENGVRGLFVNGSSGEGLLMTEDERKRCAEAWASHAGPDCKVIVHVAADSVRTARSLASHAERIGVHAISAMGPTFPPVTKTEQLLGYCSEIASAAPSLPFYYYHIPGLSGVDLPMIELLRQGEERIPNFAGIKYTSGDLHDFTRCYRYGGGKFDILYGLDETMLAAVVLTGVRGFIGGTFNYCAPVYREILAAFNTGNLALARQLQQAAMDIIEVLIKYRGNMVAGKQMMRLIGFDLGPSRSPLLPMSESEFEAMVLDLGKTGFFQHCNLTGGERPRAPRVR